MPGRLRIRRIALMEDGKGGGKCRVAQVFIKLRKLPWGQQTLIHNCLRRKRTEVTARGQERLGAFPEQGQSPLKAGHSARRMKRLDKELPGLRHGLKRETPERIGVDRNAAPTKNA